MGPGAPAHLSVDSRRWSSCVLGTMRGMRCSGASPRYRWRMRPSMLSSTALYLRAAACLSRWCRPAAGGQPPGARPVPVVGAQRGWERHHTTPQAPRSPPQRANALQRVSVTWALLRPADGPRSPWGGRRPVPAAPAAAHAASGALPRPAGATSAAAPGTRRPPWTRSTPCSRQSRGGCWAAAWPAGHQVHRVSRRGL